MLIKSQKNLNITLLLEGQVEHNALINQQIFAVVTDDLKDLQHVIAEGPDIRVMQFPGLDYNIIIESKRLLINDTSGKNVSESDISNKIKKLEEIIGEKTKAYGFNIDFVASDKSFSPKKLLGESLINFNNIREIGAKVRFDFDDEIDIGLDIKPLKEKSDEFHVHVNVNHKETIPDKAEQIKEMLLRADILARDIISKL
jgi:hypothetical protein